MLVNDLHLSYFLGFTAICEKYGAMQNAGIDQLTKTLNDYLGEIVENIISSEGDVLKFAGYDSSCLLISSSRFCNITFVWMRNE